MRIGKQTTTVLAVAAMGAATLTGVAAAGAAAASSGHIHHVAARMSSRAINLSVGHTVHAGTVQFKVVSKDGKLHFLQIARLHKGYSLRRAGADFNKAFQGNVPAVRRIDHNITFRGGAPASPGRPGTVAVTLYKGRYTLLDQVGHAVTFLNVRGKGSPVPIAHGGQITTYTYGFGHGTKLPSSGLINVRNVSDQPHFVVFQRVKPSTTAAQVARFFHHPTHQKPSFALRAHTSVGVNSPYRHEIVAIDLPRGKYVIACFWPDDDTGMPHAFMGMWKLVRLI